MTDEQIKMIIDRYFLEEATDEEMEQLNDWYHAMDNRASLSGLLSADEKKQVFDKMFAMISDAIDKCPDAEVVQKPEDKNIYASSGTGKKA